MPPASRTILAAPQHGGITASRKSSAGINAALRFDPVGQPQQTIKLPPGERGFRRAVQELRQRV